MPHRVPLVAYRVRLTPAKSAIVSFGALSTPSRLRRVALIRDTESVFQDCFALSIPSRLPRQIRTRGSASLPRECSKWSLESVASATRLKRRGRVESGGVGDLGVGELVSGGVGDLGVGELVSGGVGEWRSLESVASATRLKRRGRGGVGPTGARERLRGPDVISTPSVRARALRARRNHVGGAPANSGSGEQVGPSRRPPEALPTPRSATLPLIRYPDETER